MWLMGQNGNFICKRCVEIGPGLWYGQSTGSTIQCLHNHLAVVVVGLDLTAVVFFEFDSNSISLQHVIEWSRTLQSSIRWLDFAQTLIQWLAFILI